MGINPTGHIIFRKNLKHLYLMAPRKMPELKSTVPLYYMITIGDTERLAILDAESSKDEFFTLLYFDENGNRNLTDDTAIKVHNKQFSSTFYRTYFRVIETSIKVNGKDMPYCFYAAVYINAESPWEHIKSGELKWRLRFYIRTQCCYRGTFKAGKTQYTVTLAPYEEKVYPLDIAFEVDRLALHSRSGDRSIILYNPGKNVKIPEGHYRLTNYSATGKEESGATWRLESRGTKESLWVAVKCV